MDTELLKKKFEDLELELNSSVKQLVDSIVIAEKAKKKILTESDVMEDECEQIHGKLSKVVKGKTILEMKKNLKQACEEADRGSLSDCLFDQLAHKEALSVKVLQITKEMNNLMEDNERLQLEILNCQQQLPPMLRLMDPRFMSCNF